MRIAAITQNVSVTSAKKEKPPVISHRRFPYREETWRLLPGLLVDYGRKSRRSEGLRRLARNNRWRKQHRGQYRIGDRAASARLNCSRDSRNFWDSRSAGGADSRCNDRRRAGSRYGDGVITDCETGPARRRVRCDTGKGGRTDDYRPYRGLCSPAGNVEIRGARRRVHRVDRELTRSRCGEVIRGNHELLRASSRRHPATGTCSAHLPRR